MSGPIGGECGCGSWGNVAAFGLDIQPYNELQSILSSRNPSMAIEDFCQFVRKIQVLFVKLTANFNTCVPCRFSGLEVDAFLVYALLVYVLNLNFFSHL